MAPDRQADDLCTTNSKPSLLISVMYSGAVCGVSAMIVVLRGCVCTKKRVKLQLDVVGKKTKSLCQAFDFLIRASIVHLALYQLHY